MTETDMPITLQIILKILSKIFKYIRGEPYHMCQTYSNHGPKICINQILFQKAILK